MKFGSPLRRARGLWDSFLPHPNQPPAQPTPTVTEDDVKRVVRRDFPSGQFFQVMDMLDEYGADASHREPIRVRLAVLKLANGELDRLRNALDLAKRNYRDALVAAEYPEYQSRGFRANRLSSKEKKQIFDTDWGQYDNWLRK